MDITTLLIIVVVILLLGGGGWYRQKARGPLSLRSPTVPASTAVPAAAAE